MNNPVRAQPTQGPTPGILSESKFLPATVADIMTKDVVTLTTDQTVADAISSLANHQFHHLVITDGNGKVVGIVSDRDILRAVARTPDWHAGPVSHIMTPNPITVRSESPLLVAVSKMLLNGFNSLPVVKENAVVVGILTSKDVLWSYQRLIEWIEPRLQQMDLEK
jgi:CBS domain-containing protein